MLVAGIVLVLLAGVLHSWYAASAAWPTASSRVFSVFGTQVLLLSIGLLLTGLCLIWSRSGIVTALAAAVIYFVVLPLIFIPALRRSGMVPPDKEETFKEWQAERRRDD